MISIKNIHENKENIVISNLEKYNSIIDNIDRDWKDVVHFLADFDKTLTKAFVKWKSFPSLISILRNDVSILWKEYSREAHALYSYYSAIEKDPNVSTLEKVKIMSEWWRKHQELLVKSGLTKNHIEQAINSEYLEFRDWIVEFLHWLKEKNIPLVIISANWIGGDSIRMFFEKHSLMSSNIHIISNVLKFDDTWVTCWFENRVIHSFNKTEAVIKDYPKVYKKIKNKKNVILLGDSLWDPDMIDWFNYDNLLKIWFFNECLKNLSKNDEELYKKFQQSYNVIITEDGNFNFINDLLRKID